jgi:hypothetical protein
MLLATSSTRYVQNSPLTTLCIESRQEELVYDKRRVISKASPHQRYWPVRAHGLHKRIMLEREMQRMVGGKEECITQSHACMHAHTRDKIRKLAN